MPRPRNVPRMALSGAVSAAVVAAAAVLGLSFAGDSSAAEPAGGIQRVSVSSAGAQGTSDSNEPAISADGRYVTFATDEPFDPVDRIAASQSTADGTDPETTPDADVYVRDTQTGRTTLISAAIVPDGHGGAQALPGLGDSDQPTISGNGRYIAFRTTATNIGGAGSAIVLCDRDPDGDGTFAPLCSLTVVSAPQEGDVSNPHLSADGRRISYDVVPTPVISIRVEAAFSGVGRVEVVELQPGPTGRVAVPGDDDRTYVASPPTLTIGGVAHQLSDEGDSTMAAGGLHVAFVAHYVVDDGGVADVVQDYDVNSGALTRLDLDTDGTPLAADGRIFRGPALSGDGRRYAFTDDRGRARVQVRLYDRDPDGDGAFGRPSAVIASGDGTGDQAAFSADGRYLAFTTPSLNMHNGTDTDGLATSCLGRDSDVSHCDVVVRDVVTDAARAVAGLPRLPAVLASASAACLTAAQPCEGDADSGRPAPTGGGSGLIGADGGAVLSADGSAVAFGSAASDLIGDGADTNGRLDVFQRRFQPALAADPQDFGSVPLGAEAIRDVPVTAVGDGPVRIRTVAADPGDFDVFPGEACTTVVLHAGDKCLVSVRFRPSALGARTSPLRVTFDGGTPLVVALTGVGIAPPAGAFAADLNTLDFGARPVLRTSPVKTVTVRNTGRGTLQLGAVALNPTTFAGDYKVTADTCAGQALPAGGTCRIDVRHRPTAVGVRPGVLTVNYDGPAAPLTFAVTLTGAGAPPTLVSSPTVTPAGRVIQITGTAFPPGSTAKLSLVGMPGTTTATAAADGTFHVPFVVLPNTWTGQHPLNADVLPATAPGLTGPLRATLEFVIVPGSPVPPDFDNRK